MLGSFMADGPHLGFCYFCSVVRYYNVDYELVCERHMIYK